MSDLKEIAEEFVLQSSEWVEQEIGHPDVSMIRLKQLAEGYLELERKLALAREALTYIENRFFLWDLPCEACDHNTGGVPCTCGTYNCSTEFRNSGIRARRALAAIGKEG